MPTFKTSKNLNQIGFTRYFIESIIFHDKTQFSQINLKLMKNHATETFFCSFLNKEMPALNPSAVSGIETISPL